MTKSFPLSASLLMLMSGVTIAAPAVLTDWPHIKSAIAKDPAIEGRIAQIVAGMSLKQKNGQMTQPEIQFASPADVKKYYISSVLNGGGNWPQGNKHATAADWVALADQYYDASMATDMPTQHHLASLLMPASLRHSKKYTDRCGSC